ncbi:hypothetical protein [Carboxydocella sp. ULO1]|uniref:hypothetical protein n=1 Tax=Carboxydocella sp. ULO1 TaxID=1926599 RepID=UPI0009ACDC6B|nr:hypothetical protein [Carboxydocella sp. ULO1]GAW27865.1 hypothetical protein ULO1_04350 [Carboxydocella sp. ULO1]
MVWWILALAGAGLTRLILPSLFAIWQQAGFLRPNFRGEQIPLGVGVFLPLVWLILLPGVVWLVPEQRDHGLQLLLAVTFLTLLGMLDDVLGSRRVSGLKGHLGSLFRGRMTTGALKAVMGGWLGLVLAWLEFQPRTGIGWIQTVLAGLMVALSINAINLLDLRPGRAGKGFLLFGGLLVLLSGLAAAAGFWLVTAGMLVAYLPADLKARCMLGDTGANPLGGILGLSALWALPAWGQLGWLLFLIGFHFLTEKYSLTELIARTPWLDYIDRWGRE